MEAQGDPGCSPVLQMGQGCVSEGLALLPFPMDLKLLPGMMRCSGFPLTGTVPLLLGLAWVFADGGESQPSLYHVFLLSATPPSHPASTQRGSVLEGGMSVPELCNVSMGSSWLLRTSSTSLIVLPSSSFCFWPGREHQPASQMLSQPTHSS